MLTSSSDAALVIYNTRPTGPPAVFLLSFLPFCVELVKHVGPWGGYYSRDTQRTESDRGRRDGAIEFTLF